MSTASPHSSIRRSSSLSPTSIGVARAPAPSSSFDPSNTNPALNLPVATSLSRSASADAAAPQQTSLHLVQRLSQQNALIREAWEAERNYLEANRRRAEQVYQEERAIMEDIKESWHSEKLDMEREMQVLRERILRLEGENAALTAMSPQGQISGIVSPPTSQVNGARENSPGEASVSQLTNGLAQAGAGSAVVDTMSLPPGLEGAARRPHFASPGGGSRHSPTRHYDASPLGASIDPRTQPQASSSHDFLASPDHETDMPVPVIDVQEIDPKLEGIPIRASAVQRNTFSEASTMKSSPATSPPTSDGATQDRPSGDRRSSKEQTLQVLAVGEARRRTMHAGHTPNHSISLFPTMTAADGNSTGGQSDVTTPTAAAALALEEEAESSSPKEEHDVQDLSKFADQPEPDLTSASEIDEQEPPFEPTDDAPLKGPLMIKNIPAQDEIFWAQVNKKLEPISHGEDALPTVMRGQDEDASTADLSDNAVLSLGLDAASDLPSLDTDDGISSGGSKPKTIEPDVPLKLRTTTNFGAPFGAFNR